MRDSLRRFTRDKRGSIGLWMAVAILPITLMIGAATDLRRVETMRSAMQDASDAAILAGAKAYLATGESDPQRLEAARRAAGASLTGNADFHPDMLKDLTWTIANAEDGGGELVLTTSGKVPLAFGGLFGLNTLPVKTSAASVVELRLEIALVLDTTGSMATNNRIGHLKTAAEGLIDQLDAAARQSSRTNPLKIALVPYSNTVRVSTAFQNAAWIDGESSGPRYNEQDPAPPASRDRFTRYTSGWRGCLETRPMPHDVENTAASADDPNTLFTPYFNPGASDANEGCEVSQIVPLTRDVLPLKASVRALQIGGYTNIPLGMAWGWNALTPDEGPFGAGAAEPHGKADLVKAVVLMTDGENNIGGWGALPENNYTGLGRMDQRRLEVGPEHNGVQRQEALDARLAAICEKMKAQNIIVYAVRVEGGTAPLLEACASKRKDGTPRYWNVTQASQLPAVFNKIGQELIAVRLSR